MKLFRLVGLIFGAILAMSLVAVAVASAADPEFKGTFPNTFKTLSGTSVLASTAEQTVTCSKDEGKGVVLGASKVSGVTVLFTNCVAKEKALAACTAKTDGGITGDIITNTLDGELGLVSKAQAASGVGLLLLPEVGKIFVTISAACLEPSLFVVEGNLAGEASPIGNVVQTGILLFLQKAGVASIKEIGVLGVTIKPKLTSFGTIASAEGALETIDYSRTIEVT